MFNKKVVRLVNFVLVTGVFFISFNANAQNQINLAGQWHVRLDSLNKGVEQEWFSKKFETPIQLPGTLDDAGIGKKTTLTADKLKKEVLLNLTRKHSYIGIAWYSKEVEIPQNWKNKDIELYLDRVIWNTRIWVDGKETGTEESLSTPHRFNLSALLKPGKHLLVIRIDNTKQFALFSYRDLTHAYTEGTQIKWNGIIGKLALIAKDKLNINTVQTYPDVKNNSVTISSHLRNTTSKAQKALLKIDVIGSDKKVLASKSVNVTVPAGELKQDLTFNLGKDVLLWDEFNPNLYKVNAQLLVNKNVSDVFNTSFGMREVSNNNSELQINGRRIFLRGTLECNIFPLKGYPPMDEAGWLKVFKTAKEYGLNHIRFHSWCPPEAAFAVADSLGMYLQVELPLWSKETGKDPKMNRYFELEGERISKEYGNHPSFMLWAMGNELQGNWEWISKLLLNLKKLDPRHLYSTTSFTFQAGHGKWPEPVDEFFVSQETTKGWVRGQGIFNTYPPDFYKDYSASIAGLKVPIITHEIGQYSVYPNLEEIEKYTGVLDPLNFKAIRNDLQRKGMLDLAKSFTLASGKFSANLYKEEIERALKTKGFSGFQLLDLHDFPGQGTATIGILDAFWDSKGLVTPEQHRQYSSSVVPLIRFAKAIYTNAEQFVASAEVANFSEKALENVVPLWTVTDKQGKKLFNGALNKTTISTGNGINLGNIAFDLKGITEATELIVELSLNSTSYKNKWSIWVYPEKVSNSNKVLFSTSLKDALKHLNAGKTVLLNPDTASLAGVEGRFAPVFWSPVHFPNQPGTMGILCNPEHPALANFPTDFYSNWQWWDLITSSKTMVIDSLPTVDPIVRVIDNFYKNRKMANIIEAKVGKGKLILTSMNISQNLDKRPAARQLRYSLEQYMASDKFAPSLDLTEKQLAYLMKEK